jgi:hypothetical protein
LRGLHLLMRIIDSSYPGGSSNNLEQQNDEQLNALHSKLKALHQVSLCLTSRCFGAVSYCAHSQVTIDIHTDSRAQNSLLENTVRLTSATSVPLC